MNALPTVGGPARWEPPQRFSAVKPQLPQVKLQHNRQETGDCGNLPDTEEKHPPCQARLVPGQALVEPLNHEFNRIIVCVPGGQVLLLPFLGHSPAGTVASILPIRRPCTQALVRSGPGLAPDQTPPPLALRPRSVPVSIPAMQHPHDDHRTGRLILLEQNTPVAHAEPPLSAAPSQLAEIYTRSTGNQGVKSGEHARPILIRHALKIALCRPRNGQVTPEHQEPPRNRRLSCSYGTTSPRSTLARASSSAASSSGVSGSSSRGAPAKRRAMGSAPSAISQRTNRSTTGTA